MEVLLVPEGIVIAADRNVTISRGAGQITQGQERRTKVVKVYKDETPVVAAFVGLAEIDGEPLDAWLKRALGGYSFGRLEPVARGIAADLEREFRGRGINDELLIVHVAGFGSHEGEWRPEVWHIHNTSAVTDDGYRLAPDPSRFEVTEAFAYWLKKNAPPNTAPRELLERHAREYNPIWFQQGSGLLTFQVLKDAYRGGMRLLMQSGKQARPTSLEDWVRHARLAILAYTAFWDALAPAYERIVGGGADAEAVPWPVGKPSSTPTSTMPQLAQPPGDAQPDRDARTSRSSS